MAFNIKEIYSQINRVGGVAKSNLFSIMIAPPKWSNDQNAPRLIEFLADNAQIPGIGFHTNDVNNYGYGPVFKLPHTPMYTDIDMTVMCDNNGVILEFFHNWMQNIININSNGAPGYSGYNDARMYSVQYPSNYVTTVTITLYRPDEGAIVVYTLNDAYPLRLGQPGLDWQTTNAILRIPISFTFKTWVASTFKVNNQSLENSVASFNPFARTISGSVLSSKTQNNMTVPDIFQQTTTALINNQTNGLSLSLYI